MSTPLKIGLFLVGSFALTMIGITACVAVHHGDVHFGLFDSRQEKSERVDTRELHLAAGQKLSLDVPFGMIHVRSGDSGGGSLHAQITAHGHTKADADELLARTTIVVDETKSGAAIRVDVKDPPEGRDRNWPTTNFELTVPAGLELALTAKSGEVTADGIGFASSSVESSFGDVKIENVKGKLVANSSSGKVSVSNVTGESIAAHSGFGAIALASVETDDLRVETSSGDVKLANVRAKKARVESGFGRLDLSKVDGALTVKSNSGDIALEAITGSVDAKSGFGSIRVRGSPAGLVLETSSGDIEAKDVHAKIDAKTGFGSIEIDGVLTDLAAKSSSGSVSVRARPESRIESEWRLTSSYGKVELVAPPSLAFDLSAKTGFGRVKIGYGIEIPAGEKHSESELHGRVNGGGGALRMKSDSGEVVITPAKD